MIICSCIFHFDLYDVTSLKGRRSVTNAIKAQFKNLNVSVMDISGEYPKEAEIAIVFLTSNAKSAQQYRQKCEAVLEKQFPQWSYEMSYEEF